MQKNFSQIEFKLTYSKKRRSWIAYAHCPICGSSFGSDWKRDPMRCLEIATDSLHHHAVKYHKDAK